MSEDYYMAINSKNELKLQKYLKFSNMNLPMVLQNYVSNIKFRRKNTIIDRYRIYLIRLLYSYIHKNILDENLTIEDYKIVKKILIDGDYINLDRLDLDLIIYGKYLDL